MNIDYSKATTYTRPSVKNVEDEEEEDTCWQRRSGMERKLLLSLIIIVVFTMGCIIFIVLKYMFITEYCSTSACLKDAARISSYVNIDLDPCDDFLLFVCSRLEENANDINMEQLQEIIQLEVEEAIKEPFEEDDPHFVRKQKELYGACLNDTGSEDSLEIFQQLFNEFNGWPVVVGYRWRARLFEWTEAVYVLRKFGYPFSMLFSFSVIKDDDSNKYIIEISNPIVNVVSNEHKNEYKRFMSDVAVMFGADRYQAEIQMSEVLDFMGALANISIINSKPNINDDNGELFHSKTTVDEIQRMYTEIDWLELLNNIVYPAANISGNDYMKFPTYEYLDAFFELMSKTTKRIQANYIIWTILEEMMPYASKTLQYLKGNFTCQTKNSIIQDRTEFCINLVDKASFNMMYVKKHLTPTTKQQMETLFEIIKFDLINTVRENFWIEEETSEESIVEFLEKLIGIPDNYFNDTIFESLESFEEEENSTNFFRIMLNQHKIKTFQLYSLIKKTWNTSDLFEILPEMEPVYLKHHDIFVVPFALLRNMLYFNDKPKYLHFGVVGARLGYELTKSVYQIIKSIRPENMTRTLEERCLEDEESVIRNETLVS